MELSEKIEQLDIKLDTNVVLAGDFNFYFDKTLKAEGGNPKTKIQSIASFIKIKEQYDLWQLQHPNEKRYTFRQKPSNWQAAKAPRFHFHLKSPARISS